MKKILFALLCMLNIGFVHAATEMTDVYLLAQTKNAKELQNIKDIDIVNKNGDTALCSAIKDGNVDAYNLLKKAGANIEHKCIKKIPAQQYEQFITKVVSANNSWSFLGLGKWAWTAIGVGAAGVAAGAAVSGGGSGAGSSTTPDINDNNNPDENLNNPYTDTNEQENNYTTPCDGYNYSYASQCPLGYTLGSSCTSGAIVKYKCDQLTTCPYNTTECTNGYIESGNICISGDTTYKQCIPALCDGYDYTNSSQCPSGYTIGSSCLSGATMKYKCDVAASCPGYEYTDESQCPEGWRLGSSCKEGSTIKYKCDYNQYCPYSNTYCSAGYHETGNQCKSGNTIYKECVKDECSDEYAYTDFDECPQGWDKGSSCLSGTLKKYKCDKKHDCNGNYKTCPAGYIRQMNYSSCWSGDEEYVICLEDECEKDGIFVSCREGWHMITGGTPQHCTYMGVEHTFRCAPNTCDDLVYQYTDESQCPEGWTLGSSCKSGDSPARYQCDTPANCDYNTTSCTGGYEETGNQCKSGNNTYKECKKIQCGENFKWTAYGCVCDEGWTGQECDTPVNCGYETTSCTGGYEETGNQCKSGNNTYKECQQIQCDEHGTWTENGCVCDEGWSGTTCDTPPIQCGVNATWSPSGCICDSGYINWVEGIGCSVPVLNCGVNAHQNGNLCECNIGYTDWVEGIGCSVPVLNCGVNAHQNGTFCQCDDGYTNWTEGQGCYAIQNCGKHAYQNGTNCVCEPGYENWTPGIGCSVCGENDTTNPKNRYITDDTSGARYNNMNESYYSPTKTLNLSYDKNIYLTKNGGNARGIYIDGYEIYNKYNSVGVSNIIFKSNNIISVESVSSEIGDVSGIDIYTYSGTNELYNSYNTSTGNIIINNSGNRSIYGIFGGTVETNSFGSGLHSSIGTININSSNSNERVFGISANNTANNNIASFNRNTSNYGNIYINNFGNNKIYGILGFQEATNSYSWLYFGSGAQAKGLININNIGDGEIRGISSKYKSYNSHHGMYYVNTYDSGLESLSEAVININNSGEGNIYGVYGKDTYNFCYNNAYINTNYNYGDDVQSDISYAKINIINDGAGNTYGLYSDENNGTTSYAINADGGIGIISITNKGIGDAYGIYGKNIYNTGHHNYFNDISYEYDAHYVPGTGFVNLTNKSSGNIFGMYGTNVSNENSDTDFGSSVSVIGLQNISSGNATGIYTANGAVNNSGEININNVGTGTVFGIFGDNNSTINNSGVINITRESYVDESNVLHTPSGTAGDVFGIYAKSGSSVNNSGNITINTNGNTYGIYVESDSTVINTGTISLNGVGCSGSDCNTGNYIVLNGSTLYNSGAIKAATLQLNSMKGKVIANADSSFIVDNKLSGDLYMSNDIIMDSNQTTYVAKNMIDAGDTSELNLVSDSVMFDAYLSGRDVVMQIKDFDSLTDNKSLATFLKHNYNAGNGRELFAALKSMDNMSAFNGALSGFTGLNTFTQFAHEDLSAMREISFSMNNKLFENSGRDSFDISDSMGYFSFSDGHNGGSGQYGISSSKMSDNWKLGYGMAMANINTNDGDGMYRQNKMWLFYMPATYTNDDIELVIAPKAGFARTEYNRRGYNNMNYDGYIEKHIVGLMNDLRYPLNLGNWTFAPDLAFNTIVYTQYGEENEQEFSLIVPHDNTVSVETGLGLYGKYEKETVDGSRFKFTTGIMGYREFGDTYNIKLGMRGMDGTFDLYNNDYKYRGALNIGIDYSTGLLRIFGNTQYFMDNANYMNFKGGISYKF